MQQLYGNVCCTFASQLHVQALTNHEPFLPHSTVHPDVEEAFAWMASKTALEVRQYREEATQWIESKGRRMIEDGRNKAWFAGAEQQVRAVAENVNGALLEYLLKEANHADSNCAELFRKGLHHCILW